MTRRVLLIDDDREVREALGQTLELADLAPLLAASFVEAKDHIADDFDGIIVTDIRMPGRDGFHALDYVRSIDPDLPVILLTGEADVPMAVRAMTAGAHAFLEKPCSPSDFIATVQKAIALRADVLARRRLRIETESGDAAARMLFGQSDAAKDLRDRVRAVAKSGAGVLVTGDAGSGTPKVAEVIHLLSTSARHPFVKRSAASLTLDSLDEALAATGVGSLYLDEVGAMPSAVQFALLDVLDAGRPVRIIAGTTKDLARDVAEGRFTADLYYRLDLMRVRIPSLKERPEDIPVLFRHYVAQACEQANIPSPTILPDHLARLMAQDWPGNARGVMNAAMRFALGVSDAPESTGLGLADQMALVEKSLLIDALRKNAGNATQTAKQLLLPRKTFYDKLARHNITPEEYRT